MKFKFSNGYEIGISDPKVIQMISSASPNQESRDQFMTRNLIRHQKNEPNKDYMSSQDKELLNELIEILINRGKFDVEVTYKFLTEIDEVGRKWTYIDGVPIHVSKTGAFVSTSQLIEHKNWTKSNLIDRLNYKIQFNHRVDVFLTGLIEFSKKYSLKLTKLDKDYIEITDSLEDHSISIPNEMN